MKVAVTGGTGFIGRYLVNQLTADGHEVVAWHRESSDRGGFDDDSKIDWRLGELNDPAATADLVRGVDAVVHSGLSHPGGGFRDAGGDGSFVDFAETNVMGSLRLFEAAKHSTVGRFVFVSTCAVHEKILDDRPLDERHPTWPKTHYGAHKAALEPFVHSFGWGDGFPICGVRPTGVYGLSRPAEKSKWFGLVADIAAGRPVEVSGGGKEVHAADVAKAIRLLLAAPEDDIRGEVFSCYDQYISRRRVADLAKDLSGSDAAITGESKSPKHQIETGKLKALGMTFGGDDRLRATVKEMLAAVV